MKLRTVVVPVVACTAALFACDRDRERGGGDRGELGRAGDRPGTMMEESKPGEATLTGANFISNQTALDRIVDARCERASTCNQVGSGKKYASRDVCTREIRADMREDLKPAECPRGIDQKELNECLTEIRNENCDNPLDTIGRLVACRTSDLCQSTAAPNY